MASFIKLDVTVVSSNQVLDASIDFEIRENPLTKAQNKGCK